MFIDPADAIRTDLDETRRLVYAALYLSRTPYYELAGTLVNALVHHGRGLTVDAATVVVDQLVAVSVPTMPFSPSGLAAMALIDPITERLRKLNR